jgi:hypothetical protein
MRGGCSVSLSSAAVNKVLQCISSDDRGGMKKKSSAIRKMQRLAAVRLGKKRLYRRLSKGKV